MRTPRLFLGIFALALLLPLLLLACGGSDEPETPASPARTPSMPRSGDAPAASGSAETDREALVAFYNATNGENWDGSGNWLSDAPVGRWKGVTTNVDGRVTKLELAFNNLSGEIPAELGSLSSLTELDLLGNGLSGEIPAELGNLSSLAKLGWASGAA